MLRIIALLRHGVAAGQGPEATLLPEGAAYLSRLGAVLDAEGWRPAAVLTSPYVRARESARVLTAPMRFTGVPIVLDELLPEIEPRPALQAILRAVPFASPVLVVSHMPLLGGLAQELVGEDPGFSPGTLVEIAREGDGECRLLRRVGPSDLARP